MKRHDENRRLQPKMGRSGFRLQVWLWSIMALVQLAFFSFKVGSPDPWILVDYLRLALMIGAISYVVYLFYVRRHDGHFWDEEDARRADWERRGRQL